MMFSYYRFIFILLVLLFVQLAVASVDSCIHFYVPRPTHLDGLSGWGTQLFPAESFRHNARYQANLNIIVNSNSSLITPYWMARGHAFRGKFDGLMSEWNSHFGATLGTKGNRISITDQGMEYSLKLLELRSSGTEANNYFYELAGHAFQKRTGKKAKRPQLLFFADPAANLFPYGGTFGRSAEMSIRYVDKPKDVLENYAIPSPQTKYFKDLPPHELVRVTEAENKSIEYIRQRVADETLEVGGIMLEPVSVSKGIHFYRPEFLLRLRALADELGVPIMVDEVYTGGGRTGKFWAFQLYEGFYPDLISFGKGLELKGVGWIERRSIIAGRQREPLIWDFPRFDPFVNTDPTKWSYENVRLDNTSIASALDVARALVVMETLEKNNLVQNAKANGEIILNNARARANELGLDAERIQGIGMIFHFGDYLPQLFPDGAIENYLGRVTPLITTTPNDFPAFKTREL